MLQYIAILAILALLMIVALVFLLYARKSDGRIDIHLGSILPRRGGSGSDVPPQTSAADATPVSTPRRARRPSKPAIVVGCALLVTVALGMASVYSQDVGEVIVLRNLGGSIAGHSTEAGFHLKAPWQAVISYDTRNNLINFYGDAVYSYEGGSAGGADVTINDASGAAADIDIQVNYSLDPEYAEYLYSEYGTQENYTQNYVSNDVRSVAREVAGQFDTITMLTDRGQYTRAVQAALEEKWSDDGLTVENVSVQDVRYPETITSSYAEAQSAQIDQQRAQNEQETARIEAETRVVEAQGEADANAILTESLTPEVLQQRYIDALTQIGENGNLVVVPEGSQPIVGTAR